MREVEAWAVVDKEQGKLYTDECAGLTRHQYRIYRTKETATANMTDGNDMVVLVTIMVPEVSNEG